MFTTQLQSILPILKNAPRHFIIIDLMPCVYAAASKEEFKIPRYLKHMADQWVSYMSRPVYYTPVRNPANLDVYSALPIFLLDMKDSKNQYWRHKYLKTYKAGRKPTNPQVQAVRDVILDKLCKRNCLVLAEAGMEADDLAGLIVRNMKPSDRCGMVTVDGDWSQLVSDSVFWMDTYPRGVDQQVLGVPEVLRKWNSVPNPAMHITQPHEIVRIKQKWGDTSDSILAKDNVPLGLIDLLNPLEVPQMYTADVIDWVYDRYDKSPPQPVPLRPATRHHHFGLPNWLDYSSFNPEQMGG
jgi:5'-3' exonuclease, N-terminal resolvase-like domain